MSLTRRSRSGVLWFGFSNVLSIATSLVVMRVVGPEDFGVVAWAAMILSFLLLVGNMGMGTALIQRRELPHEEREAAFWFSLAMGCVIAALLWLGANPLARFLETPTLAPYVRVMALAALFVGGSLVPRALLQRELHFTPVAAVESVGSLVYLCVTLSLLLGARWGIVAVAWGFVARQLFEAAALWWREPWRPQAGLPHLRESAPLLRYGRWVMGSAAINFFAYNSDSMLVGKLLGTRQLGLYNAGYQSILVPVTRVSHLVLRVLFPILARQQDDRQAMRRIFLKCVRLVSLITFPSMLGLAVVAEPAVSWILDPRWAPLVPLIWIFAPIGALKSVSSPMGTVFEAMGRPQILFLMICVHTLALISAVLIGVRYGMMGVAGAVAAESLLLYLPFQHLVNRQLSISWFQQGAALLPATAASILMMLPVLGIVRLLANGPASLQVLVAVPTGVLVYMALLYLFFRSSLQELFHVVIHRNAPPSGPEAPSS